MLAMRLEVEARYLRFTSYPAPDTSHHPPSSSRSSLLEVLFSKFSSPVAVLASAELEVVLQNHGGGKSQFLLNGVLSSDPDLGRDLRAAREAAH